MEKICKSQIVEIAGAMMVLVGMFLPWATVSWSGGSEVISIYGRIYPLLWIFFILVIIGAAIPKPAGRVLVIITGFIGHLYAVWIHLGIILNIAASVGENVEITIEYGGYMIMAGFALAMFGGILHYILFVSKEKTERDKSAPAPEEPAPPP